MTQLRRLRLEKNMTLRSIGEMINATPHDGAVVLSGYDSHIYAPLTKNGWDKLEIEVCCSAAGRTRNSGLQGEGNVKAKQRRTEVIWRNPEAMKRIGKCK